MNKILLFIFFTSITLCDIISQNKEINFEDKTYYLLDSIDLSQLSKVDKVLIDSCLNIYHSTKKDTSKIAILSVICENMNNNIWMKYQYFQYDLIQEKIKQHPSIKEHYFFKKYLSNAQSNIGYIHGIRGNISLAIDYYKKSLIIQQELNDEKTIANSFNNLGYMYMNLGDIPLAIEYHSKSLKIREQLKDTIGIVESYNNIGMIHKKQGNTPLAIKYFKKSVKLQEYLNNKRGIIFYYNNLGYLYLNDKKIKLALDNFEKSLKLQKEVGDQKSMALTYINIGSIYKTENNFNKSLEYFNNSLKLYKLLNDKLNMTNCYNNIGELYLNEGLISSAKKYGNIGLNLAKKIGNIEHIKSNAHLLNKIAVKEKKYKVAFEMYQLEVLMRDSIINEKTYKASIKQQYTYEYEKKKSADSIINAEAKKIYSANLEAEKAKTLQQITEVSAQKKQNIFLFIGLGLIIIFSLFIYNRFKVTKRQNYVIENQKIIVENTLNKLESTHDKLEKSHKEITDSINYAERIQRSFLTTTETLDENLKDYFVFFKPKEAVSGDFYWSTKLDNNNFAFTVADSTGHGVPGAIMSLLNITSLEKAVETELEPHNILNKTREIIIKRLKKDGSKDGGKDGMDCSLMVLNKDKSLLTFSSANNPVIIIRNKELLEYKGDKIPVGKHDKENESFTLQTVTLQKGDVIYALTDGFQDQFGGPKGKKYMIKNLKRKLIEIVNVPMIKQKEILSEEFNNWKGELEQIDDVCIIGVRV